MFGNLQKLITVLSLFPLLLLFSCDNSPDSSGNQDAPSAWKVIENTADLSGVWEGSTQIALLSSGDIFPATGIIGLTFTLINDRLDTAGE